MVKNTLLRRGGLFIQSKPNSIQVFSRVDTRRFSTSAGKDDDKEEVKREQSIFIPSRHLTFDAKGSLLVYECQQQIRKMKVISMLPLPVVGYFGYCLGYNVFIAHSIFKSILWLVPFIVTENLRRNLVSNATSIIDSIYLKQNGTSVVIKSIYGTQKVFEIKYIRKLDQSELGLFQLAGGQNASAILQDYYPILIDFTGKGFGNQGEGVQEIFFIEKFGTKHVPDVTNAILNGVEIDTTFTPESSSKENNENTIDI